MKNARVSRPVRSAGKIFVTGLLTVLPLVLTLYFTVWLLSVLETFFGKQVKLILPDGTIFAIELPASPG